MSDFESAYLKYQQDMYRAVRRTGVPVHEIWDCVQEAGRKISQMQTVSYMEPYRVRGLFCKVAQNVGLDYMRTAQVAAKAGEDISYDRKIDQQVNHRKKEIEENIATAVHSALSKMSDLDSFLAWKYYGMQMSLREISEDLLRDKGIQWDHVRIHRYLKRVVKPQLKECLIDAGGKTL